MGANILVNVWKMIRKFGLDYDDFPTIIDNIALLLRILTINIRKSRFKRIDIVFYVMTAFTMFLFCYVYMFSMIWMLFYRYDRNNITTSFVVLALGSCSCSCITKVIFMKLYSKEIKTMVANYLKCDSQVTPNTRFARNLRKNLRVVKRRALFIWISLEIDAAIYLLIPLITPGRHFASELYLIYGLEPMLETPNYEIATLIITASSGFSAYTMATVSIYVTIIAGYNEAQLRALGVELRNLWDDSQNFYNHIKPRILDKNIHIKKQILNEFIRIRLRDIIRFHTANINLRRELIEKLQPFFAVEYIIMVFSIITDLLGGLRYTYNQIMYTFILILINCHAGQRLVDANDDFERSLYTCQWENFNNSNQRTVLLMLRLSQKPLVLSAGGVTKLNFKCVMFILKSSYSTYTTLQSTVKKQY